MDANFNFVGLGALIKWIRKKFDDHSKIAAKRKEYMEALSLFGIKDGDVSESLLLRKRDFMLRVWHPDVNPSPDATNRCICIIRSYFIILLEKEYVTSNDFEYGDVEMVVK